MEERTKKRVNDKLAKLYYHNDKIKSISEDLRKLLQKFFTFKIDITHCAGDGFLILNVDTADVIRFNCLDVFENNILNEADVMGYSI